MQRYHWHYRTGGQTTRHPSTKNKSQGNQATAPVSRAAAHDDGRCGSQLWLKVAGLLQFSLQQASLKIKCFDFLVDFRIVGRQCLKPLQ
jgi:hypothetical protein